jgi:hypothetical protein
MGRTTSLALTGGYQGGRKDRDRRAAETVRVDAPLGDYPGIDPMERELWEKVRRDFPNGALKATDELGLELLVKLWAKSRREKLNKVEFQNLYALMGKFGLSPADRSKVKHKPGKAAAPGEARSRFFGGAK